MHSFGKGMADSTLPYKRQPAAWSKTSSKDVIEQIVKFAKKGLPPSQIGVSLRDSAGVSSVKNLTGRKVLRILKHAGMAPEIPEDLYHMVKKALQMRKHLEKNRKDKDQKFRLILIESRIHRLARYYRRTRMYVIFPPLLSPFSCGHKRTAMPNFNHHFMLWVFFTSLPVGIPTAITSNVNVLTTQFLTMTVAH